MLLTTALNWSKDGILRLPTFFIEKLNYRLIYD